MIATLPGPRVTLRPLDERDVDDQLRAVQDPEALRLTGTHRTFTRTEIVAWCRSRAAAPGRYDWAVVDAGTGDWLGECALNEIDPDNESAAFRIALDHRLGQGLGTDGLGHGPVRRQVRGQGLGTEATGLVLDFAFGELGLHRVELEVFDFNLRAQKSYAKSGFTVEGVKRDGLLWEGARHDVIMMAALSPAGIPGAQDR